MWHVLLAQVWTHSLFFTFSSFKVSKFEGSTDFSFETQFLQFVWIYNNKIHWKNQYLSHLCSDTSEINFVKSDLSTAFQQHHEHLQIPIQFSVLILFSFHSENGSIINSFHTVAPNNPSQCTFTHPELSKDIMITALSTMVWKSQHAKQNRPPCFMDRFIWKEKIN
jgi:hypothetical protein